MGAVLLFGGLALLIGIAASSAGAQPRPVTPEDRLRQGTQTPEDLEGAAEQAEQRGMTEEASAIRDRAEAQREAQGATPSPAPTPAPTPAETPAETPEERIRQGTASPEDLEGAAEQAEQRGMDDTAAAIRDRAEAARQATTPAYEITEVIETREPAPAGFDPSAASGMARALAQNITARQYNYDRNLARNFQRAAGITVDGIYGPGTRGALIFFGIGNAPRALFDPRKIGTTPYPENLAKAARVRMA